jgi:hypothetical protein
MTGSVVDVGDANRFDIDPMTGRNLIRHVVFEETTLIRGENIAVPNRYHGFLDGCVMIGCFNPGSDTLCGVYCLVMEEAISIPKKLIEFKRQDVWIGVVSTSETRDVFHCQMVIHAVNDDNVSGTFSVDCTRGLSTCKFRRSQPDWRSADFSGVRGKSPLQPPLGKVEFHAPFYNPLLPKSGINFIQYGQIMIGFFRNPKPSSFYLMRERD